MSLNQSALNLKVLQSLNLCNTEIMLNILDFEAFYISGFWFGVLNCLTMEIFQNLKNLLRSKTFLLPNISDKRSQACDERLRAVRKCVNKCSEVG